MFGFIDSVFKNRLYGFLLCQNEFFQSILIVELTKPIGKTFCSGFSSFFFFRLASLFPSVICYYFFTQHNIHTFPFLLFTKQEKKLKRMGNCPIKPSESASKSLHPLCKGERMWTTFLFSSLFTLFGGWFVILIYDIFKALVIKQRRLKLISIFKRFTFSNDVLVILFRLTSSNMNSFSF